MQSSENVFVTGFTQSQRTQLRAELDEYVRTTALALGHTEEAVVQELRYWQQSAAKGHTNPTEAQKKASFRHWDGVCCACGERILSLEEATFHHLRRGISGLHSPENMVPLHRSKDFGCHEKLHGVAPGSFTAGSMRRRP